MTKVIFSGEKYLLKHFIFLHALTFEINTTDTFYLSVKFFQSASCVIDSVCVAEGDRNWQNTKEYCNPQLNKVGWTKG